MRAVGPRWRLAAVGFLVAGWLTTGRAIEQMPPEYTAKIFHVSPQDGDAPAKAAAFVRKLKAQCGGRLPRGGVIVEFADGVYPLSETWVLGEADSGTPECPVRYRAQHPGKAVLTGARALDWRPLAAAKNLPPSAARLPSASRDKVLTAELPAGEPVPGFFAASRYLQDEQLARPDYEYALALYQGDDRVENARWPNEGWARVTRLTGRVEQTWIYENSKSLPFESAGPDGKSPDLAAWKKEPDLYLHGSWKHEYVDTASKPEMIDPAAGLIAPARADAQYGMRLGAEYFAFNAVCELDRPGEWALDVASRRLYVWPRQGADMPRLARTKTLLSCRSVTDVTFEGFVFEAARGHAVKFADCRDVTLEKSVVRHTTGWGVCVERGRGCRVEGCDLYDLGEGGVWLEGGSIDTLVPSRHVCDNCRIHDYAVLAWNYNPGVRLFGCGNEAMHNLVYNAPQQACFFYGAENRFAWNVVHDVCRHTDDAGAIYTYNTVNAWANRGNVIEHNAFHRIAPEHPRYCQLNAIYLDAFTSGTVVRGNITSESSLGVFSSGGQDNFIEGNVLVHARNASIRRWNLGLMGGKNVFKHRIYIQNGDGTIRHMTNESNRASYLMRPLCDKGDLYRMSFWSERFPNMLKALEFENPVMGHCAQFCTIRKNVAVDSPGIVVIDLDLTKDTTVAEDATTFPGDPGFVDFLGMNWELKPDSPARKALGGGTRFGEMGLYASAKRITPPVKWGPDVTRPLPFNPNVGKGTWTVWRKADGDVGAFVGKAMADGVANVFVTGVTADPRPFTPATEVCEALSAMESFAWDFADGSGRPFEEVKNGVVDLAIMYPKLKAVVAAGLSDKDRQSLEEGLARAPQKPKVVEVFDALRK